jgi:acetyl esterase/lipase
VTPARGAPCLVVIHGGGWDSGDRTQLASWNVRWAARGWAVAALDYRLAPRHPWPAAGDDIRAALAWLKAESGRLGVDPARFALLGRSAGGQIATAVAYGAGDPAIRGVIALYSPHDMPFAWSVSREDDTLNSIRLFRQYLGGPPDTPERAALYASASGQGLARAGGPPALLLHGYPDTLVWHRHSRRMAARLAEIGVACTHLELPWATHAFDFNADGPGGQLADFAIARFLAGLR